MALLDKLAMIKLRFDDVAQQIIEPEVIADMKRYVQLNKEYKDLTPIVESYLSYKTICDNIEESNQILATEDDAEMKEMARMELDDAIPKKAQLEEVIKVLLIPKDPEDSKNAVVEIRAGAGGDEASIFAGDLFRMYSRYCESKNGEQNS
jgi:peptide chain release factor 1